MKRKRTVNERKHIEACRDHLHIDFLLSDDGKEFGIIAQGDTDKVKSIDVYRTRGERYSASILDASGLGESWWKDLRQALYHDKFECDKSMDCTYPRSAHVCHTRQYSQCKYYSQVEKTTSPQELMIKIRSVHPTKH